MTDSVPVDYVAVGLLKALYEISSNSNANHSLTADTVGSLFESRYSIFLSKSHINLLLKRLDNLGIVSIIVDPYADPAIETTDSIIHGFVSTSDILAYRRGWSNEDWLISALKNLRLWQDLDDAVSDVGAVASVPSADGFVTVDHNSAEVRNVQSAVNDADEALRIDNQFDTEEKGWIRVHLGAGVNLLRSSGPVLRRALIALIIDPLKAAFKMSANDNVKRLVNVALMALLNWLGG